MPAESLPLPHQIAVLCYLFDAEGRVLLLHRRKPPNRDLYSPVGGKLERDAGESPTACAVREVHEETGLTITEADLHLTGVVSETAYQGQTHWLMFLYELTRPVAIADDRRSFDEGTLDWYTPDAVADLPLPQTDRDVIWPQFWAHRGRFFAAHIDCTADPFTWRLEQSF
ncbi:MAG: NUDIX domain-containing protein [Planctomycetota bacterium]